MSSFDIKDIIKSACKFEYYRAQVIYYSCFYQGYRYIFPIDLEDVGGGTLENEMKGIILMRWIRKSIEEGTFIKHEED